MQEIKDFINDWDDASGAITVAVMRKSSQYKALKALVYKPVPKVEVTDELAQLAIDVFMAHDGYYVGGWKAALEAIFDHISHDGKKVNIGIPISEGKQVVKECDQLDRERAYNVYGLHVGYTETKGGIRYFEALEEKKEPQKQTLLEYAKARLDFRHLISEEVKFAVISAWMEQK